MAMVLEAVYEKDFHDFSYGFRPGRSAHQPCEAFQSGVVRRAGVTSNYAALSRLREDVLIREEG